ncbi:DUF2635 domain-containing protein [Shinella pollutisoli]|uniref:DUF2635 domain-containing protein n=1 Tax=Shinella pollutisoli TaxID=2250594 RepID=A0ABV7DK00_9HYPH|nr:DUF2635 domain-containing protein [Shinella pollutisoli]
MAKKARTLKPGPGRTVLQEDGTPWPADGMEAPDTAFVRRRIRDEDLVPAAPKPAPKEASEK